MTSLTPQRPLMMMLVGIPGAGKSFFARQFADTFGIACARTDRIRHELFANPTFNADENNIISRVLQYMVEELIKTGKSFLIDGDCNTKASRDKLVTLAKEHGYGTLVIWVQTDLNTARSRSVKRTSQKIDDIFNPSLSETQFEVLQQRFLPPTTKEPHVVISGKHAYSTQARTILRKLATPRLSQPSSEPAPDRTGKPQPRKARDVMIR